MQRYEIILNWQRKIQKNFGWEPNCSHPCDKKSVTIKKISLCFVEWGGFAHTEASEKTHQTRIWCPFVYTAIADVSPLVSLKYILKRARCFSLKVLLAFSSSIIMPSHLELFRGICSPFDLTLFSTYYFPSSVVYYLPSSVVVSVSPTMQRYICFF